MKGHEYTGERVEFYGYSELPHPIPSESPKLQLKAVAPWTYLRARMGTYDCDQKHLARLLKRGSTYVSTRLNGHALWDMEDALTMMTAFQIKPEDFLKYFGRDPVLLNFDGMPAGL